MAQASPENLTGVLDQMRSETGDEKTSLGDILDHFGSRAYGPILVVVGLLAMSPVGAIPGMTFITGTVIMLIAGQLVIGKSHPWLPRRLTKISFSSDKLEKGIEKFKPVASKIDALIRPRLTWAVQPPADRVLAALAVVMSLCMHPLGFIPFAVAIPSAAVILLGLAMTARDGVLALLSAITIVATFVLTTRFLLGLL